MNIRLIRNIYHHSPKTGLTSITVFKDYKWDVPPVIGATVDDSAWHRNDTTYIASININAEEGDVYYVELNSKEVEEVEHVKKLAEVSMLHGWDNLYKR